MLAVFASSPGQTYVVSVFVGPIQRDTGWSRTLISALGSLTAASGILVVGRLMDRVGARATLAGAGLGLGLAALWMSRVDGPLDLYLGFALLRLLGQGALTVVPTATATAAAVFTVMAPSPLVGTFVAGTLLDRVAGHRLLPVAPACLIAAMLWSTAIVGPWQAFAYGGLLGFTSGFGAILQSVIWPSYFGRRQIGSIRSAGAIGMMAAAAIGPLPFGWMFDVTASARTTVLVFLIVPIASALAGLVARPPRRYCLRRRCSGRPEHGSRLGGVARMSSSSAPSTFSRHRSGMPSSPR
jgi:MFS family permease